MITMALIFLLGCFILSVLFLCYSVKSASFYYRALILFNRLYSKINTYQIADCARKSLAIDNDNYIYGEIDCQSFVMILEKIKPQPNEWFYDLGSGAGKAVFAAALFFELKAIGVELLSGLHQFAIQQQHCFMRLTEANSARYFIDFVHADFLQHDFFAADILFVNATCFHYILWTKLTERLTQLKKGSRILVISKKITGPDFLLQHEGMLKMSWGWAGYKIYVKMN